MYRVTVWLGWAAMMSWALTGCAQRHPRRAASRPGVRTLPTATATARTPVTTGPAAESKLPTLTERSSLGDYLAYAALNNPGLEAAFNRWKAALEQIPQVKALPDPRFTYRYYIVHVETRTGPQRQAFGLAQMLPWFGKLALRGDVAAAAAEVQRQHYEAARRKLFYQVKDAFYEYYYLRQATEITRQNLQLLKNIETIARVRYKAAAARHPDVIRVQVELGKLEDRLRALQALRGPLTARLNAVMNRPVEAPLAWPGPVKPETIAATDQQVLAWLVAGSPELKAFEHEIARSKAQIALAKKGYFPDLTVGLSVIDTGASVMKPSPSGSGDDPVILTASINVPIWWDRISAGVRQARHRHLAAVGGRANKANALQSRAKLVLYRYRDAGRKINLYRHTLLPKARQSLTVSQRAYQAGTGSFLDLLDAERILLAFALGYERALSSQAQRLAELEMLVGRDLPRAPNPRAK